MTPVKAIIFDLGNVVFSCSFDYALEYWAGVSGQDAGKLKAILDMNTDKVHEQFEKAVVSADQFRLHISEKIGYPLTAEAFEAGWNAIYADEITGMDALLRALKPAYRIIGLTNTNETHAKVWKIRYSNILQHFETIFASSEIGCRKPDAEAFERCLQYLGTNPEETIFLDDRTDYVQGAEMLGIKGIVVSSFPQMTEALEQLGVRAAD